MKLTLLDSEFVYHLYEKPFWPAIIPTAGKTDFLLIVHPHEKHHSFLPCSIFLAVLFVDSIRWLWSMKKNRWIVGMGMLNRVVQHSTVPVVRSYNLLFAKIEKSPKIHPKITTNFYFPVVVFVHSIELKFNLNILNRIISKVNCLRHRSNNVQNYFKIFNLVPAILVTSRRF